MSLKPVCQMKGDCGGSFFQKIPCANTTEPDIPSSDLKVDLLEFCPQKFENGVCCTFNQFESLKNNVNRLSPFVSNCPACMNNLKQFFCEMTCGDQSMFNITETALGNEGKPYVVNATLNIQNTYGEGLFDSCKEIKLSAANAKVIDFIGGGAKNWKHLVRAFGTKSALGSPYTIVPSEDPNLPALNGTTVACSDPLYKCACLDCPVVCPDCSDISFSDIPYFDQVWLISVFCTGFLVVALYALFIGIRRFRQRPEDTPLLADVDDYNEDDLISASSKTKSIIPTSLSEVTEKNISTPLWYQLQRFAGSLGFKCSFYRNRLLFTLLGIFMLTSLCLSLIFPIPFETDPVHLWSSPSSPSRINKVKHDRTFGPFYRIQQAILSTPNSILNEESMRQVANTVLDIKGMTVNHNNSRYKFDDLCLKIQNECVVYSVFGYFKHDLLKVDDPNWKSTLNLCLNQPTDFECLPPFLQPLQPNMVLADYKENDYFSAKGLQITLPMQNFIDSNLLQASKLFELKLLDYFSDKNIKYGNDSRLKELKYKLVYSTESSIELEVDKATSMDFKAIFISYFLMFFYVLVALYKPVQSENHVAVNLLKHLPYLTVLCGIALIINSIAITFVIMVAVGVKPSFILLEVLPFLVLAVGVDNIFLITNKFHAILVNVDSFEDYDKTLSDCMSTAMIKVLPSVFVTLVLELSAFLLAMLMATPAVTVFCLYAACALFINMVFQIVFLPAILTFEKKIKKVQYRRSQPWAIDAHYTKILFNTKFTNIALVFLGILFLVSLAMMMQISLGLEQVDVVPITSYLKDYFQYLSKLSIGAPVYFSVNHVVFSGETLKQTCGRFPGCKKNNVVDLLTTISNEYGVLAGPPSAPMDDFISWLDPQFGCCGVKIDNYDESKYYIPNNKTSCIPDTMTCKPCVPMMNRKLDPLPNDHDLTLLLKEWLKAPVSAMCMSAGETYASDVKIENGTDVNIAYRTYHSAMSSQLDFIEALQTDFNIMDYIKSKVSFDVGVFSSFHVFFEQYLDIKFKLAYVMALVIVITILISVLVLGSIRSGFILAICQVFVLSLLLNMSALLGLQLNSILAANLIMSMGITFEFCSHILIKYLILPMSDNRERVKECLMDVGNIIFTGIGTTKFVGVLALSLASSVVFQKYYFIFYFWFVVIVLFTGNSF
eukprot:NODE_406_length_7988_cov_0.615794.p1 type:complete len:1172 gc:universal NODE_406_length_7988_cov_0.615794:4279-7794(+)